MFSSILVILLFSGGIIRHIDATVGTVAILLDNLNSEFGAKVQEDYRNLVVEHSGLSTLKHDPAMQQVVEGLMRAINQAANEHGDDGDPLLATALQSKLAYTVVFVARRLRIPMEELGIRQSRESDQSDQQQRNAQLMELLRSERCNNDNGQNNGQEKKKRILQLLWRVANDNPNSASTSETSSRKSDRRRRRKKRTLDVTYLTLLLIVVLMWFINWLIQCYQSVRMSAEELPLTAPSSTDGQQQEIVSEHGEAYVEAFRRLPKFHVSTEESPMVDCRICLGQIEVTTAVIPLPPCNHFFHTDCIEKWLIGFNTCPICRANIFKPRKNKHSAVEPNFPQRPSNYGTFQTVNVLRHADDMV